MEPAWRWERRALHIRAKSLAALLAACFWTACAPPRSDAAPAGKAETPSSWTGRFELRVVPGPYYAASIAPIAGPCVPVLIDRHLHAAGKALAGGSVTIDGEALQRPRSDDATLTVRVRDRWLVEGSCGESDIVIYARRIRRATTP